MCKWHWIKIDKKSLSFTKRCCPRFLTTLHQYIMGDNGSSAEGCGSGKGGLAKLFIDGEQVGEGSNNINPGKINCYQLIN